MASQPAPSQDPTLHKPRILCLHGGGTNALIFRAQCRSLSRALAPHFRLVYAEAPYPSIAGPDVLSVYADCGPFKRWLRWLPEHEPPEDDASAIRDIDAALDAAMSEDDARGADGEWAGLLGFSQGAKMVASLLFRQQVLSEQKQKPGPSQTGGYGTQAKNLKARWRFAVPMAGRSPLVLLTDPAVFSSPLLSNPSQVGLAATPDLMEVSRGRHVLRLPTIHVHGLADPGYHLHRELLEIYCDPATARLVEWDGAHRVPLKTEDVQPLVDEILDVARETGVLD